ncbi:resolvase/recombinase protein [Rhizobium sp. N541]|uniref:recombinase family protein n=1 Tax=unclassified Rhizobium TaxID=2613769 RepID=UPI0007F094A2|nr:MULTISPECIES: recombinase family protein [unclassified Rhizobium]ANM18230.1 resolvase/recombinase protein [Rhizobium sp. N541]ANM24616.1 resolvase/recombinase protein [Rhizobium sp. N941]
MTRSSDDKSRTQPLRAYSYVRMSSQRQLRGDSLRRQLEQSRAYADEHSLLLDDSLQDLGVSAWKGRNFKHGALGRFLTMVENGEISRGSYLLIESLDRLSREAVPDALTLFMAIINAGIVIVTLGRDGQQIYSRDILNGDWTRLIIGLAVMSRGHEESQIKSERVGAANKRKREKARAREGHITGLTPSWIDAERLGSNRYAFTLNEHTHTVRAIYEMAAHGLGSTAIARHLNANGVPTFGTDNGWYQSIIKLILKRADVIGAFQPHRIVDGRRVPDGDAIEDYFPAAIDKDLFLRVQAMRDLVGKPGRKGRTFANLLTGLCHCAHCRGPMTMKISHVKEGQARYLACGNHVRGHRCNEGRKNFRYEPIEAAILDHVKELDLADALQSARFNATMAEMNETIAGLALQLDDLRRRESRLAEAIEDGNGEIESVVQLLKVRQAERQAVEVELRHRQQERQRLTTRVADTEATSSRLAELRGIWQTSDNDEAKFAARAEAHAAIRELVSEITFDGIGNAVTLVVANGVLAYRISDGRISHLFDAFKVAAG